MKVLVGLSGGVDSAVAASLLMDQGHEVTGCFMRNWDSLTNQDIAGNPTLNDPVCSQEQDYQDAKAVADKLGIELLRNDFIEEYWNDVFQTFIKEYEKGRTPNPDILCNQFIKFDAFYNYAMDHGFDAIATGHYCAILEKDGKNYLARARDQSKDQTYFLAQVPFESLQKTLFPLGEITKKEVRQIASDLQLDSVSSKKDSTGICFIGERNFRQFLSNYIPFRPGRIISLSDGRDLGEHQGVFFYTIGQRKGLNIQHPGPWFVAGKDVEKNELYVCHVTEKEWLVSDACLVEDIHWLCDPQTLPEKLWAKFRYRQPDQPVKLELLSGNSAMIRYPQGIASVTPGQECVLYDEDRCLGGGVIQQVFYDGKDLQERIQWQLQNVNRK